MKKYLSIVSAFVLIPCLCFAINIPNPLKTDNFKDLINKIVDLVFTLGLAIAPIMIVVAGVYFIIAQGEPQKIQTGQAIIKWTFIGLIILICAKAIVTLFMDILGVS